MGRVCFVSRSEEISLRLISCSMGSAMAAASARIPSGDSSASDIRRAIVSMYSWLCTFMRIVSISFSSCNQMSSRNLIVPPETETARAMTSSPACTPAVSLPLAETFRSSPGFTVPSKTSVS